MGVQPFSVGQLDLNLEAHRHDALIWKAVNVAERICAAALLLLALPAVSYSAAIVLAASRRSPFIAHQRVGQHGRVIWVLKLRTMWGKDGAEQRQWGFVERISCNSVPQQKPRLDARVSSRFAALCRRYSWDELPQLWNVVTGDLSLVGPRPLTAPELAEYYGVHRASLVQIRPGITGLWQIKGRSRLTYAQRRRLDLFMLRKWSVSLYLFVLAATIPRVLSGEDAW